MTGTDLMTTPSTSPAPTPQIEIKERWFVCYSQLRLVLLFGPRKRRAQALAETTSPQWSEVLQDCDYMTTNNREYWGLRCVLAGEAIFFEREPTVSEAIAALRRLPQGREVSAESK